MNIPRGYEENEDDVEDQITDTINRSVRMRTGATIEDLVVNYRDGILTITGRAHTYYTKQLATHAVRETVDIDDDAIRNDIEVY
jgi:hypothetical protein